MQARQLPIDATVVFTAATDPNSLLGRPAQYTGKVAFHDSRLDPPGTDLDIDSGGTIETFDNEADAQRRYDYITAIAQNGLFAEYDYLIATAFLRIAHALTPDQANEYAAAFTAIVNGD